MDLEAVAFLLENITNIFYKYDKKDRIAAMKMIRGLNERANLIRSVLRQIKEE